MEKILYLCDQLILLLWFCFLKHTQGATKVQISRLSTTLTETEFLDGD